MKDIRPLEQTLSQHLPWNKARVKFVAAFMLALIAVRSANLSDIADALAGKAKKDSQYKKLQRFFRFFELPYADLAQFVVALLGVAGPWTLAMDRTNWKFGQAEINFLVLGIVHQGIAYPIVWYSLGKAGNSDTEERIALLEIFIKLFGKDKIARLVADREFVGKQWLQWLRQESIHFELRLRYNTLVANGRGQMVHAYKLFRTTGVNQARVIPTARRMWGDEWYFSGCYLGHGEYLILVSPTLTDDAVEQYAKRWQIETLFAALKSRGFDLEATHMTDPARVDKLFALLALTFCWCHKVGEWLHQQKELKLKNHGRKPKSLFRRGFEQIRRIIANFTHFDLLAWQEVIEILSCT